MINWIWKSKEEIKDDLSAKYDDESIYRDKRRLRKEQVWWCVGGDGTNLELNDFVLKWFLLGISTNILESF